MVGVVCCDVVWLWWRDVVAVWLLRFIGQFG